MNTENLQCFLLVGFFLVTIAIGIKNRHQPMNRKTATRIVLFGALVGAIMVISVFYSAFYGR